MSSGTVAVFFYGLFMDESGLAAKGVVPSRAIFCHLDGYTLRIGRRATLVPDGTGRTYGVIMTLPAAGAEALYSEEGVADYVPEPVTVVLPDGTAEPAVCYNLPENLLEGTNPVYASSLLTLATKLGLPDEYLRHIRSQGNEPD
jgi:hypothetical protein